MDNVDDSGRRRSDDADSPAGETVTSDRPHLDKRRERLDAEIGRIIEESMVSTAHHESISSALESIALQAFEKGCGQDALIKKFKELGVFETDGVVVKALRISIEQEIDKHYASLGYDTAKGVLDRERERLVNRALRLFLKHMGAEDCITEFFKNLVENRYKLLSPLLNPSSKQEDSVSRDALCTWALSDQTLGNAAARMGDFVKPVITEAYGVYIGASPDQYVQAVFNNVIGIDEDGAVKIYFTNMDELMGKVCTSINFETFWDTLMSHKDLLAEEYHAKFPGKRFYAAWVEEWKDYLQQRWNSISGKEENPKLSSNPGAAPEGRKNGKGGGAINATRAATAARALRVYSRVLPPGAVANGGSGTSDKAQVVLILPTGPKICEFFVRTDILGDPKSLRDHIRGRLTDPKSGVAKALLDRNVRLEVQAGEIDDIFNKLIAAGKNKVQGVSKRHYRKKH